jgi:ATP-dependent RNA helicase DeaD
VAITIAEPRQRRLLGNIERLTKQTFTFSKVPTVADLRERQIELTVAAVRDALASDDLDDYNAVLHGLAGEDSERNIALAAIKLAHAARGAVMDEAEIPDASDRFSKRNGAKGHHGRDDRAKKSKNSQRGGSGPRSHRSDGDTGSIYIALGRKAGIRPGDLVGAIANESGLSGSDIGPIRIADHFSVVGVPESSVDEVISAIKATTIRGKPAKARRYVD